MLALPKYIHWSIALHLTKHDVVRFGFSSKCLCQHLLQCDEFWVLKYQQDFGTFPDQSTAKDQYFRSASTRVISIFKSDVQSPKCGIKTMCINFVHLFICDYGHEVQLYSKFKVVIPDIKKLSNGVNSRLYYLTHSGHVYEIEDNRYEGPPYWNLRPVITYCHVCHIYAYDNYMCFITSNFGVGCGDSVSGSR